MGGTAVLAFFYENLRPVLCALLLLARIGDIGTTYLVTPNLILEANPIVRKLGWPFALLTVAACFLPYVSVEAAVTALMTFFLVSASNAGKIWIVRAVGEKAYAALMVDLARRSKLSHALLGIAASAFFVALAGGTVLLFYPSPAADWGFWLGLGILLYAGAVWFYGTLAAIRLFRRAALPAGARAGVQPTASRDGGE
ncbi:MAG TPA: hypothetical protein VE914_09150 [Candidatus Angelobacter sp.]|nr:hypothetical protein [Candidatus Angelobacter sp.]